MFYIPNAHDVKPSRLSQQAANHRTVWGVSPDTLQRVLRGGSWHNHQSYATATSRLGYDFDVRYLSNGFRIARDLN